MIKVKMTWDDIYGDADGSACGEWKLKRKDIARAEIVDWVFDNFGYSLEVEYEDGVLDCVEDYLDTFAEKYNLVFDEEGHICGSDPVPFSDKITEARAYMELVSGWEEKEKNMIQFLGVRLLRKEV